jgi:hypothetical protein
MPTHHPLAAHSSGDQQALAFVALKSKYLKAPKYVIEIISFSVTKSWLF